MDKVDGCKTCDLCGGKIPESSSRKKRCSSCSVMLRRTRLKIECIDLLGGVCAVCGWSGHLSAMEFHHIGEDDKEFSISKHWDNARNSVLIEVSKCELLCSICHAEKHSQKYNNPALMGYVFDYKGDSLPPLFDWGCNRDAFISCWRGSKSVNDGKWGVQKICRICGNLCRGAREKKDVCSICLTEVRRTRKWLAAIRYKGGVCSQCGWSGVPSGFAFHHTGGDNKDFNISRKLTKTWERVREEVDKCSLLCKRCHNPCHSNRFDERHMSLAYRFVSASVS